MNQVTKTTTSSDIASILSFPERGEILSGNKILDTETKYQNGVFKYRINFTRDVRRSDVPNILRAFFNNGMVSINGVDHIVENHDYQTRTTRKNTVVIGSMQITPLSMANPVQKKLTALQDFDNEYEKMVLTSPETYFRAFSYRGFDGPAFRSKLFSFVSNMGENYGYCDDKTIYHRRASLVMPKIKITKAPENAKMFYHTHPKRDEPSLSSADDYLIYFDMSHKPRNIRHFYTVMADRMDYFHIVPKHSKKKDYVKINEDKFLEEVDNQIDEAGKRLDEVMSNETYQDDLVYCEKVTREVVKWLNKKYEKYFTITYKCHYKVKKNPEEPSSDDLHLGDEFIGKALNDLKTGEASWPEFKPKDRPQEKYAYWHSKYFAMNKDAKGLGYMGLMPGDDRRFAHFLHSPYRGSNYTYDDILSILCISNDIKIRDAKIRDGKEIASRIEDILDYLEIDNEEIRGDIILYDAVVAVDAYGDLAQGIGEEHNFILPIADFSIKSVEAMNDVDSGKKDLERAKHDIMFVLKEKMAKTVTKALGKKNKQLEVMREPVPVYGQDGPAVSKVGINPPVQRSKREYQMTLPSKIFDNPELLSEILEPFKKNEQLRNAKNAYTVIIPVDNSATTFVIQSTGTVQVISPSKGYPRADDPDEATLQAVRKLVDKLNEFGFEMNTDDIAFGTTEPMRNPRSGVIIAVTGPIRSTKNKFIDSLSKRINANVVTTFTTKTLKEYEKRSDIVEVTDEIFDRMEINGELVVVTKSYDGHRRGFSKKDMKEKDFMLVNARIKDLHFLISASPSVISFYLHPTNTEAVIESYLSDSVSPQEARRVAGMIDDTLDAAEGEVEHIIEYDIERPAAAIEEVYNTIPKPNPMPKPIGSIMGSSHGNYYLRVRNNPSHNSCPAVTQNLEMNTKNRNSAIKADYIKYGPLNLADEDYWVKAAEHWNTTPEVAKESKCGNCVAFDISPRMLDCMPGSVQDDGQLGMCWMHNFKCHSARTCYTWAAGGPITEDSVSYDWQERSAKSNPQKKISIRIDESTNPEKKLMAVFTKPNGRTKTVHFGARGMSDYTQHKDKDRMKNYLARHGGMGEDWNDPMTAGALSRWILWGKPSLRESFNDFKKRFNLEGVMAVTNTKMNPRIPKKYEGQDPSEHSDLYTDEDPEGTIQGLGFKDKTTAKKSIQLIKKSGKTHAHKIQAAMAMEQRARFHPHATKGIKEAQKIYAEFIEEMKEKTKSNPAFIVGQGGNTFDVRVVAPTRDPIMIESLRAATDKSFKHHKWYVKHHLDYVMAIMKRMPKVMGNWDKQMVDMVWMHDYPKMMGKGQDLSVVNDLLTTHRGEDYAHQVVHQLHLMERLKKSDWNPLTEYSMVAANLSTADALSHYYGPFFQIYIDENPDMSMEEIKKSNRQKLAKDKLKLRAGPMKDGLDSIRFQYKGRKVKIVGNEHIKALIEKKNPSKTPEGRKIPKKYLKGLNKEEMAIAAKEIDKGYKYDIDDPKAYEYWKSDIQATARGYKTVPSKYKKKFIQMYGPLPEEGKFLDKMAKATKIKKSILEKVYDKGLAAWRGGHRPGVQQHQWAAGRVYSFVTLGNTVKKGNKKMPDYSLAIEAGIIKDNPPSFIAARDPKKWAKRYDRIIKMSGKELMEEANEQAAERGLTIQLTITEPNMKEMMKGRKNFPLQPKYEKLYKAYLASNKTAMISIAKGGTIIESLEFTLVEESAKELIDYLESRQRWPKKKAVLPLIGKIVVEDGHAFFETDIFPKLESLQRKSRFPIAIGGLGGYEMSEGQQGKGYYGIIKMYQAGFLEDNGIEAFGSGESPMRSDLYQSYGWLTPYSYKENYPYPSTAAEYYLNLNKKDKLPNKSAYYDSIYRPVYSGTKSNPNPYYNAHLYASGSTDPFFPGDVPVAPPALLKNPPSKVIIVSGPSGSGKSTISKAIAKELGGTLVPTVTTRPRRPKEKEGEDRIFVSKDEFKEMINNNEFVEYKQHKDGVFYGRRKVDMDDISIVEVSLKGMKEYKKLYPDSFAVFLEPDKSPREIEQRLLSRGGMSEANAKARASIIPKQVAAAKTMPYDLFTKSRTGKYSEVAKEIISQIPMANPGWRHGEAMDEEDDPFADQFEA